MGGLSPVVAPGGAAAAVVVPVLSYRRVPRRSEGVCRPSRGSGCACLRTSVPGVLDRTVRPPGGSTFPRDPYVDNNTRTSRFPLSADSGLDG